LWSNNKAKGKEVMEAH
jgi:hypothetical protein